MNGKKVVSFPPLKSLALDKYPFLVGVTNSEMELNYNVNGEKTESLLRKDAREIFTSLEKLSQTEILVAILEDAHETQVTVVARNEHNEIEQRQEVFQDALPANWFKSLMGFDYVVSATVGGEIAVKTSTPCRIGEQGVVLGHANTSPLFSRDLNAIPDAVIECVRPLPQRSIYRIVWEKSPAIVKPWSRVWLPN